MNTDIQILQFCTTTPLSSRAEITAGIADTPSYSTMKRLLAVAVKKGQAEAVSRDSAVRYSLQTRIH